LTISGYQCQCSWLEQLTHDPKYVGYNPAAAGWHQEKITGIFIEVFFIKTKSFTKKTMISKISL
jgi:hypothetical protein